jgi:hypothetical protein
MGNSNPAKIGSATKSHPDRMTVAEMLKEMKSTQEVNRLK